MQTKIMIGLVATTIIIVGVTLTPSAARQDAPTHAQKHRDKVSYGVGYYLGHEVREGLIADGIEPHPEMLLKGFRDGFENADPDIPIDELDEILFEVQREMQDIMIRERMDLDPAFAELVESNLAASLAYMEEFAKGEGVIALDNGILYRPLVEGDGASPTMEDSVVMTFRGTLADGTVFAEGEGVESPMRTVTEGARIVLQMMQEGDRWEVVLPPDLAYGMAGDPPIIGPNQALHFDATLLEVK